MTSPADVVSAVAPPGEDLSTLRELLAHLRQAIDDAEHKPGEWRSASTAMGTVAIGTWQWGAEQETCIGSFSYKRDGWLAIAAVNALPELMRIAALASEANRGAPAGATAETPPKDQS